MSAVVPPDDRLPAEGESTSDLNKIYPRIATHRYTLNFGEWGADLAPLPSSVDDHAWQPDGDLVMPLPPAPAFFLHREDIVRETLEALPAGKPVVLCGAPGSGKTTLLHHFVRHPDLAETFTGGILYLDTHGLSVEDIAQMAGDCLASNTTGLKVEGPHLHAGLKERSILILLDNTTGKQEHVEALTKVLPFLICTGEAPYVWENGCILEISGLSGDAVIAIFERTLRRSLTAEERVIAPNLSALLDGNPLALQQVAACVRDRSISLADFFRQNLSDTSEHPLLQSVLGELSYSDRQVIAALAAIAPGSAHPSTFPDWIGDGIEPNVWDVLTAKHLVSWQGDRVRLAANLTHLIPQEWEVERCRDLWLTQWVERANADTSPASNTATNNGATADQVEIARAIAYGVERQRWWDVAALAQPVANAIATSKRWEMWRQVLDSQRQAARALDDPSTEALALHQLGARALALGDCNTAYDSLFEAEYLREPLGEPEALAVTRRALSLALAERPIRGARSWKIAAAVFLSTAALGGAYWGWHTYLMPRPAIATIGSTHLDFEKVQIERDLRRRGVVIASEGLSPVDIQAVRLGGERPEDFSIVENTCEPKTPLQPKDFCLIGVEFKPTTEGGRTAIIKVFSDSEQELESVLLTGVGTAPKIALDTETLDFGALRIGILSQAELVAATSTGTSPLDITKVSLSGTDASNFQLVEDTCSPLPPAAAAETEEEAETEDTETSEATTESNEPASATSDPEDAIADAPTAPEDPTPEEAPSESAEEVPSSADSEPETDEADEPESTGDRPSSNTSTTEDEASSDNEAESTSEDATEASADGKISTAADEEETEETPQGILAPEENCTVSIAFAPSFEGAFSATLNIESNAVDGANAIALSGAGIVPRLSVSAETLDFGSSLVGSTTGEQAFYVDSTGSAALGMDQIFVTGGGKSQFQLVENTCAGGVVMSPGSSCIIRVVHSPTRPGAHRAQVTVTSNAPDGSRTITLTGAGTAPEPDPTPTPQPANDTPAKETTGKPATP